MLDYRQLIEKYEKDLIRNRRYLHQHPELGFDLDNTVRYVKEELTAMGCEPKEIGNHGVTAVIGKREGRCILLRADMDALPMKEESGLPFACTSDSAAHTCGHDTHTAMLLTAARIFKELEEDLPGKVKLLFQPAEEIGYGCRDMVENGILENPRVDAAFGEHIMSCFPKETVLYGTGSMSTGADLFTITVHGKGGHGSVPHTTIDPINIACHIVLNLQTVNSREVDAKEMAAVNTDARVTELTGNEIKKHMDLEKVNDHTLKLPFSEDFSYISERVPSAFFLIGACPEKGEVLTQHNPRIIFDEESMKTGVLVYVAGAVGYLKQGKEETI